MKSTDFITEHSDWPDDPRYTPSVMNTLGAMCDAIRNVFQRNKINLRFSRHFYDQLKKKRGLRTHIINPEELGIIFVKILKRGYNFFENKPLDVSFAFHDPNTNLYVEMIKRPGDTVIARTVVRDIKWLGRSQVIDL